MPVHSDPTADQPMNDADRLPSWREGGTKAAIVDFVRRVTDANHADYVEPSRRIATFDNDGTLWCEKPMPIQLAGVLAALRMRAEANPAKREVQPFKAAYENDMAWFGTYLTNEKIPELLGILLEIGAGETQASYEARTLAWFEEARHPRFATSYKQVIYQPMLELLDYLRQHDFKVFICTGGGMDFVRLMAEEIYGIVPEYVIGANMMLSWEARDGDYVLVRQAGLVEPYCDGPGKPVNIQLHVGHPPILAAGNSDGDVDMLRFAAASGLPFLNLMVRHDDAEREYAYTHSAEEALRISAESQWHIISIQDEWKTVFPTS